MIFFAFDSFTSSKTTYNLGEKANNFTHEIEKDELVLIGMRFFKS